MLDLIFLGGAAALALVYMAVMVKIHRKVGGDTVKTNVCPFCHESLGLLSEEACLIGCVNPDCKAYAKKLVKQSQKKRKKKQ